MEHLKLHKIFMIAPIAIEILQSWISCRCFDFWDVIFSLTGILIVFWILHIEKKLMSNK
jgi:glycopeptide antibiotics resistance protein